MIVTNIQDSSKNDMYSIHLSFNYADEFITSGVKTRNTINPTSNVTDECLSLTVVKPNKMLAVKSAIKMTSRISFKSLVASIILTIANFFI